MSTAPQEEKKRTEVMSWLMFQMGGLGPMQGQVITDHSLTCLIIEML